MGGPKIDDLLKWVHLGTYDRELTKIGVSWGLRPRIYRNGRTLGT